ncbi:MobF family relaxase [Streptosporangium canum]|uniref:MobF family relaxase n=1 Tax=Streptosporangium canum TaxID=324952 RepID=UPI0037B32A2A
MHSIGLGYDPAYLVDSIAPGAENYYLSAVAEHGEPPGIWTGRGAEELGFVLGAEVDAAAFTELYSTFHDPRDPNFLNKDVPAEEKARLGRKPPTFKKFEEALAAKLATEPEASPERRRELEIEVRKEHRGAVYFLDLTYSPPKSVTLLHAGLQVRAQQATEAGRLDEAAAYDQAAGKVWDAIMAGNQALLDYYQAECGATRTGFHGKDVEGRTTGRWIEAPNWVVASFRQHTSRNGDPQLHVHNAALSRVQCADGVWRSLDSRAIHKARPAAGAVAERVTVEQMTATLGVEHRARPDGNGFEIVGVSQAQIDTFSSRRVDVLEGTERGEGLKARIAQYEKDHGRPPSARTLFAMAQHATKATKRGKEKGDAVPSREEELRAWQQQATAAERDGLAGIPDQALGRIDVATLDVELGDKALHRVLAAAVADAQQDRAEFNQYTLTRMINRHLPEYLGGLEPARVTQLLQELTAQAVAPGNRYGVQSLVMPDAVEAPAMFRRADGRSVYAAPCVGRLTTDRQLARETGLLESTQQLDAPRVSAERAAAWLGLEQAGEETPEGTAGAPSKPSAGADRAADAPQAEPSAPQDGPGRAAAQGQARDGERTQRHRPDQDRAIYNIATSGRRTDTLVGPAGAGKSYTVGKLKDLWQQETGAAVIGLALSQNAANVLKGEGLTEAYNIAQFLDRVESGEIRVEAGQLIIIDEASMVPTEHLAEIQKIGTKAGAKLVWTGDPAQLSAPEAGGMMRMVVAEFGAQELTTVERMQEEWERQASLGLREGSMEALGAYDRHGRIVEGDREQMETAAYRAYLADYLQGRQSLLIASTNEKAAELAGRIREELVRYGKVAPDGITLRDRNTAGVGDLITARSNDRKVTVGGQERLLSNRDVFEVIGFDGAGGIQARLVTSEGAGAEAYLPYQYVRRHVELGYAGTVHAAQGRTVDSCYGLVDERTTRELLYVSLTRGRDRNQAYVITSSERAADLSREAPPAPGLEQRRAPDLDRGAVGAAEAHEGAATAQHAGDRFAVLAGVLQRQDAQPTAIEAMRAEQDRPTHMAVIGSQWTDVVRTLSEKHIHEQLQTLLRPEEYERISADPARASVLAVLRRAELSGLAADQVLAEAVTERDFEGARSIAQVLHGRIEQRIGGAEPEEAATWRERTPDLGSPEANRFAQELAAAMDERTMELAGRALQTRPQWLTAVLGADRVDSGADLAQQYAVAGPVAAYREQYGYAHPSDPIGPEPGRGEPEQRAAWRSAFRALGYPAAERDVTGATDGQLWVMRAAYEREAKWAPAHVTEQQRAAEISAHALTGEAALLQQQAQVEADPIRRDGLEIKTRATQLLAEQTAERRTALGFIAAAREAWHRSTAGKRLSAMRADEELRRRHPEAELPPLHPDGLAPDRAEAERQAAEQAEREAERQPMPGQLELFTVSERERVAEPEAEPERLAEIEQVTAVERVDDGPIQLELDLGPVTAPTGGVLADLRASLERARYAARVATERDRASAREAAEQERRLEEPAHEQERGAAHEQLPTMADFPHSPAQMLRIAPSVAQEPLSRPARGDDGPAIER